MVGAAHTKLPCRSAPSPWLHPSPASGKCQESTCISQWGLRGQGRGRLSNSDGAGGIGLIVTGLDTAFQTSQCRLSL